MNRDEHYAEGERLLAKSKDDNHLLKIEWRVAYAAQAQAHFLAALAAQPPLVEVQARPTDETILKWGS